MNTYEFDATKPLALDQISAAFCTESFVVLKNIFRPEEIEKVRQRALSSFAELDSQQDSLNDNQKMQLHRREMPVIDDSRSCRTALENFDMLINSKISAVIEKLLNGAFLWHYPPQFRRLSYEQQQGLLPFHQDFYYNDRYPNILVCFIPLNDCGDTSPSIELVRYPTREKLLHESNEIWEFGIPQIIIDPILAKYGTARLNLQSGDAVLFDAYNIHRTHANSEMKHLRYSMDVRAVRLEDIQKEDFLQRKYICSNQTMFYPKKEKND